MKKTIAAMLAFCALTATAQTGFSPDPKGIQSLKRLITDDFQTYLQGGAALLDYGLRRPDAKLTARELSIAFSQDARAAEAAYKGKWLLVGGPIRTGGVTRDGRLYVDLAGDQGSYSDVRAEFDTAIQYRTEAPVNLLCQSAGRAGSHPLLKHCANFHYPDGFDPSTQLLPNYIDEQINEWFSDGKVPAIGRGHLPDLFVMYWAGTHLPPYSPSQTNRDREDQLAPYLQMKKNQDPEFVAAYERAKSALHLPALPSR